MTTSEQPARLLTESASLSEIIQLFTVGHILLKDMRIWKLRESWILIIRLKLYGRKSSLQRKNRPENLSARSVGMSMILLSMMV